MTDVRHNSEVLEQDGELVDKFQETNEGLTQDDAIDKVKDFVGEVQSMVKLLKTNRTNLISSLADKYRLDEDEVNQYVEDYWDSTEE